MSKAVIKGERIARELADEFSDVFLSVNLADPGWDHDELAADAEYGVEASLTEEQATVVATVLRHRMTLAQVQMLAALLQSGRN